MNNQCDKCGLCCKLIPVDTEKQLLLRDGFQPFVKTFSKLLLPLDITTARSIDENYVNRVLHLFPNARFYSCKFLAKNNKCLIIDKPDYCKNFPSDPLALIPGNCLYSGEIFIKSEIIKQKVRKCKEYIIHYEAFKTQEKNPSKTSQSQSTSEFPPLGGGGQNHCFPTKIHSKAQRFWFRRMVKAS